MTDSQIDAMNLRNVSDVYYALSRIYSCKFADTAEEIQEAIEILHEHINKKQTVTHYVLINKIEQLKKQNTDGYQSKLYSHIKSHYWEKEFQQGLQLRKYNKDLD